MSTIFHLDTTSELNADFLNVTKLLFKNQRISVTVEAEMDETEYLISSEANKLFLEKSINQINNAEIVKVNFEDL